MSFVIEPMRTDEPFRRSCEAYGNMLDAMDRVFWWSALKLKLFGECTCSHKEGELDHAIRQYADARVESALWLERSKACALTEVIG